MGNASDRSDEVPTATADAVFLDFKTERDLVYLFLSFYVIYFSSHNSKFDRKTHG